ncbi:hypothetical protein E1B28_005731 [Marasmius oreades]|uniref:Rab-GAP TBC domain-containing protein n=1 Tax=Marasmius oreades TaxID=181124 RepID=A0A9P7UV47_9AGAR|nr:uncharacterized protein E1B28_005731 [Marasmius oreades]KAG7094925.1 hypothetical protein E1B28_005731 [Marasmius oreades]
MSTALDRKLDIKDWLEFRKKSLLPGGFGEERKWIWPKLLFVENTLKSEPTESSLEVQEHKDERQIQLDTDRSFVLYPDPVDVNKDRQLLQEELRELLVSLFRRRPRLHYFQGFHDVVTVLFLTLPEEVQVECVEKLSLHRLRDSMGPSLEPVLGLLRFMNALLRVIDPEYAATLEQSTPLPYFALSNLLTLFSHDMPTLPLIQHVFDYLLCRPPIMVVYLVTAITLSRKAEVKRLQEEGDDGMMHSLLANLPHLTDEMDLKREVEKEVVVLAVAKDEEVEPKAESIPLDAEVAKKEVSEDVSESLSTTRLPSEQSIEKAEFNSKDKDSLHLTEIKDIPLTSGILSGSPPTGRALPETPPTSPANPNDKGQEEQIEAPSPPPMPATTGKPLKPPAIPLVTLLEKSDSLYQQYPPNYPELKPKLSDIMGPQSVVFTWTQDERELPSDDTAENMVDCPQLVVYPAVEESEGEEGSDHEKPMVGGNKKRNKLRKARNPRAARKKLGKVLEFRERKTMVAGAVLVLGVAMAVYGVRSGAIGVGVGDGRGHAGFNREWKKIGGWVGLLLGSRFW